MCFGCLFFLLGLLLLGFCDAFEAVGCLISVCLESDPWCLIMIRAALEVDGVQLLLLYVEAPVPVERNENWNMFILN